MGNVGDCTPEVARAVGFSVASSALEYARLEQPELVEWLEAMQLQTARAFVDLVE